MTTFAHHKADGTVDYLQCDDHRHEIFHSFDSERDVDDPRDAEDQELARCVADAVVGAIRGFRKGDKRLSRDEELERREKSLDEREAAYRARDGELGESRTVSTLDRARGGRDALADPKDPRRDFRSGDARARDGKGRAVDSRRGVAADRRVPAINLDEIFPSARQHPHVNAEGGSPDIDSIFGGGTRH